MDKRLNDSKREDIGTNSRAKWGKLTSHDLESQSQRREHLEGISADSLESPDACHHDDGGTMEDRGCGGKVETASRPGSSEMKKLWVMF